MPWGLPTEWLLCSLVLQVTGAESCRAAGEGGGDVIMEEEEEEEPSWELPPELQEFQGDSSDRKLLLAFRQKQQAARQVTHQAHSTPMHGNPIFWGQTQAVAMNATCDHHRHPEFRMQLPLV